MHPPFQHNTPRICRVSGGGNWSADLFLTTFRRMPTANAEG
jgi:hypothetical protein